MRRFLGYAAVALALTALAACGGKPDPEAAGDVTVEDLRYVRLPGGARIVSGTVHNTTAKPVRNAQIRIGLYDEYNRLVTAMSIMVQDVDPGKEKPFREPVDVKQDVRGAKVQHILVL